MKRILIKTIALITFIICFTVNTEAQITSATSGNWSAASTWVGGVVPTATDNVVIAATHAVSIDVPTAMCNSISFGANTSKLALSTATSVLSIYGDFTVFSTTHIVFTTWATGAKLKFTGPSPIQNLSVFTTSNTTMLTTFFMEIVVDKSAGKVTTPGGDVKINIGTSLDVINGTFELASTADIQGRSLDGSLPTTPTITIQDGGTFDMAGGASHIGSGTAGTPRPPIGKLTVFGNANLACGSTNKMGFSDVDIENGGQVDMPAGRGASTSSFNPGTITVKSGGVFKSSTTAAYWNTPATLIVNQGGEFNSAVSGVTSLPSTVSLLSGSTVRYSLSAAQPMPAGITTYENLIITNPGIKSLGVNTTVNGTFSIRGSAMFSLNGFMLNYGTSATLQYGANGQTTAQTSTNDEWPATGSTPANITILNTGGVTLHESRNITGTLNLAAGTLILGTSTVTANIVTGGSATAYVHTNSTGGLTINNVGNTPVIFPVGFASYTPAAISNAGTPDAFTVNVTPGAPCNASLGNSVNRVWNITENTTGGSNATISLQWNATEENAGFLRNNSAAVHCSSNIDMIGTAGPANGTGPFSQTISNVSVFSPFGVTNSLVDFAATALITPLNGGCKTSTETVTIAIQNNSGVAIDFNKNNIQVNATASSGYASSATLNSGSLAAGAGMNVIMPTTIDMSAGGNFIFNANTSSSADLNPANNAMSPVTINATPGPGATITYSGSPYCKSVNTAQAVTRTGTSGGTFSSTPFGLSIDPSSGSINPSTSTAGTYTVTYTIAASGGCGAVNATTSVSITAIPAATIQYNNSPYCSNTGTATVTRNGTPGGTYSALPAGLVINSATGDITLSTSIANNYTVTYTIAAGGGCSAFSTSTTVTVNPFQNASFNYGSQTTFCQTAPNPTANISGTPGGTFSATPQGLVFTNNSTGEINLSASQLNNYTITYTTTGPCANSSSLNIVITSAPSAAFTYGASAYCKNSVNPSPIYGSGAGAGTFSSSPAGLAFVNTSTGEVNLSASTAGTYTITNFIAAGNGCGAASSSTNITISAIPAAAISYSGSPFCSTSSGSQFVTRTGTAGGNYSAPAGLNINSSTGDIIPSLSTPGTYTVSYTIPASGGCAVYSTNTSVIITTAPAATINYGGSPFCSSTIAAQPVTRSGTGGGVYTVSPIGLSINSLTGAITPSTSTPGSYVVTYTVAATGGCSATTTSSTVTVTSAPSATISYVGTPFCADNPPALVSRTGNSGGTYSSTNGLVINATNGTIDIANSLAGTYTISYVIPPTGGCALFSTSTSITIRPLSIAPTGITTSFNSSCGSNTLSLSVLGGTLVSGASWNWYTGSCGGTNIGTGATLSNISITGSTSYYVRAEGGSCSNPQCATTTVIVNDIPLITITASSDTLLLPGMNTVLTATVTPLQPGSIIQWLKNGTAIPGANGTTLNVDVENFGLYTARITTSASCSAVSNSIRIAAKESGRVFIAPNPTNGKFKVRFLSGAANFNFTRVVIIYDSRGSQIYAKNFPITGAYSSMDVDISNQKKGLYYLVVRKFSNGEKLGSGIVIIQ